MMLYRIFPYKPWSYKEFFRVTSIFRVLYVIFVKLFIHTINRNDKPVPTPLNSYSPTISTFPPPTLIFHSPSLTPKFHSSATQLTTVD